jgi:uncharacterized protein YecA (UPF0149 family)
VRVPIADATWSTWNRYCRSVGISMGRAVAALVEAELDAVVSAFEDEAVLGEAFEDGMATRLREVARREERVQAREEAARAREVALRRPLSAQELRGVGRNDRCPCDSGLKFKRCHSS